MHFLERNRAMYKPDTLVLRNAVADLAERSPLLWRNLQQLRFHNTNFIGKLITPRHHITLEGFPRSANSFALRAFLYCNGGTRYWAIGTHTHRHAQVTLSVRWNIPTLVVIRNPREAIVSLMSFFIQSGRTQASQPEQFSGFLRSSLRYYIRYHQQIEKLGHHIVISDFPVTTKHFDNVIHGINSKFGTNFKPADDYSNMQREIFETGGKHLSPNLEREKYKKRFLDLLECKQNAALLSEAIAVYESCRAFSIPLPQSQ